MTPGDPYSFEALWRQYRACRRNKRRTRNALAFELDAEANLLALQDALRAHTYRPGMSVCFVTDGPKPREVFAADFRDRVVHHLLVSHQEPVFERLFIHDSYACRRGRGTLAASDRLMGCLRQATANGRRPAWALHLDVASFSPSIHKETLYALLAARVRHPELCWLTRTVLFHDPTTRYRFRSPGGRTPGPTSGRYPVPAEKSLFGGSNARGLPIGNLTSQFWGNVYLNELDHFVKRRLGVRHYVRYVDDLVLVAGDPARLRQWREAIDGFVQARLHLRLRAGGAAPVPAGRGVDFVGWRTWWDRRLPRRRTVGSFVQRLDAFERQALRRALGGRAHRIELPRAQGVQAVVASYAGHLRHGRAWRAWTRAWQRPWLRALFARRGWRCASRWPARGVDPARGFGAQYRRLVRRAGRHCLVFCPVGRFVEFRGPQRLLAARALGLRTAHLPRAGYALAVGFPAWLAGRFAVRAVRAGLAVAVVRRAGGCRRVTALLVPAA